MLIKKSGKTAAVRIGILMPIILSAALVIAMLQGNTIMAQIQPPPPPPPPPAAPPPPPPPPPQKLKSVQETQNVQSLQDVQEPQKGTAKTQKNPASVKQPSQVKYTAPVVDGKSLKDSKGQDVYTVVEKMPEYPGGNAAMIKFLAENIKYPQEARTKDTQGTVYVSFIVEEDGTVSNTKIIRGVGGGCDEEALRVVTSMPKWVPGQQKGKAVRVQFNLPIKFRLGDDKVKPVAK